MKGNAADGGAAAGASLKSYATGFVLSVLLTAIPFALVMQGRASRAGMVAAIAGAGVVQLAVHLYFFLHLDASSRARWNWLAFIFALLVMVLVIGGTVWIMYNLAYNLR
ncbi:MAG TPA: cytochrome o ubiquinol oxidase subunit IV [Gallionellaceae bacterium]|nr:cytochrome o ubiquinol oxidase subunit IV [Gallionellaceae bacterium]